MVVFCTRVYCLVVVSLAEDIVNLQSGVPPARHSSLSWPSVLADPPSAVPSYFVRALTHYHSRWRIAVSQAWRELTGRCRFIGHSDPLPFRIRRRISAECISEYWKSAVGCSRAEYGQFEQFELLGRLSHLVEGDRSDAALCFYAAKPSTLCGRYSSGVRWCDDQRRRDESLMMFPGLVRGLITSLSVIPPLFTALPCELVTHALNSIKGLCF